MATERRNFLIVIGAASLLSAVQDVAPVAVAAPPDRELQCEEVLFPVALEAGGPTDHTTVGWLCSRGPIANKTVQVLVHGATYDHNYWDWPLKPDRYSYVRAATEAGYATLALDRLGHGESSRVPGAVLDLNMGAFAIHQVIQQMRAGVATDTFGTVTANRVLLVGESIGGNLVWLEAGTYHDVDGLIVASSAHVFSVGFDNIVRFTIPVEADPRFKSRGYPPDYFTTQKGTRGLLFFYEPNAEQGVIQQDERLKQTITLGENTSVGPTLPVSQQVDVPTLVTVGDFDFLFCTPPSCTATNSLANEASQYGPGACAEVIVMPDAGHNLNLHKNAPAYFDIVHEWAARRVGASSLVPAPQPCAP
jgi:pimeloyl-ACP methyl ester carboxylesterase